MKMISRFIKNITRLKKQGEEDLKKTELARVLSTLDLTLLGNLFISPKWSAEKTNRMVIIYRITNLVKNHYDS